MLMVMGEVRNQRVSLGQSVLVFVFLCLRHSQGYRTTLHRARNIVR